MSEHYLALILWTVVYFVLTIVSEGAIYTF